MESRQWIVQLAVIAYLPISKLRDVLPDLTVYLAAIGILAILSAWLLNFPLKFTFGPRQKIWISYCFFLLALGALALLVSGTPTTTVLGSMIIIVATILAGLAIQAARFSREKALETALYSVACLVIASTALFFVGIEPANSWSKNLNYSSSLRAIGLFVDRGSMPLTGGGTSHSAASAVVLAGMITLRKFNTFGIVAIGCAIWGLLVGDGRAAMAACLGAILFIEVARGRFYRFAFVIVPAGYFIFSIATWILVNSPIAQLVGRANVAADIETGNSRTLLWGRAFEYLAENPTALFTGHGLFGHQTAGIIADNRFMIGFHGTDKALTMHSTSVQALVDGGVLGLAFLTLILFLACREVEKFRSSRAMLCAAALMTCMMVNGIFDVWMTPYFDEGFYLFGLVTMALIVRWPAGFSFKVAKKRPPMATPSQPQGVGFDGRPVS